MQKNSLLFLFFFLLSCFCVGAPPVPFSGKLAVDGKNFHGNALFAFSIVDGEGAVHWKHATENNATIENFVLNGRYLVLLGGQGMQTLPANLFLENENLFLRVRVDLLDGKGVRLLQPDQPITSTPYALAAELARLAEKASVADAVIQGAITADMIDAELLADLNKTITISDLHEELVESMNRPITREMLPQDVRDDLNRTIGVSHLSAEVNEKLNRDFTIQPGSISKSLLGQDVLGDLNRTILRHHLSEELRAELNRTIRLRDLAPEVIADLNDSIAPGSITLDMLASGVRADLNRTITKSMLSQEIKDDLNRTIRLRDLAPEVIADLNDSIAPGSISLDMLASGVRTDLNRTITKNMLSQEIKDDLNRTIGVAQLSTEVNEKLNRDFTIQPGSISKSLLGQDVLGDLNRTILRQHLSEELRAELNRTIRLRDLAPEVIADLNDSIAPGSITLDMLASGVRADLNRTVRLQDLSPEVSQSINRSISLNDLDSQVITELNNSISPGSISLNQLSQQVRDEINRTITKSNLGSDVLSDLNSSISLNRLSPEVLAALQVTPSISTQPFARYDWRTDSATIEARGRGHNISYKWLKNGEIIAGANAPVLELSSPDLGEDANFSVQLTNSVGQATSQTVTLQQAIGAPGEPIEEANATQVPRNGLILWLDGEDLNADGFMDNLLSGTNLVQWTDKVSGKHAIPTTSTNHPTIAEESVYFDGSDNIRIADLNLSAEQIFIVLKKQKLVGNFLKGEGGATHVNLDNFGISKSDWFNFVSGDGDVRISKGPNRTMYDQIFSASLLKKQTLGNDAHKWNMGNSLEIGRNSFKGHVYEVMIYDRVLNQIERDSVEDFLIHKWQIETSRQYGESFPEPKPETDMVAYWKFDKVEIASTMIWDFSGNDRHLGTSGLANENWISGVDGDALFFDGSNDKTGDSRSVGNFNFRSVCFWVKPTVPVDGRNDWNVPLSVGWGTSGLNEISFNKVISTGSGHFSIGKGSNYRETLESYNLIHEGWFHLAAVFDQPDGTSGGYSLYLNGDPLPLTQMVNSGLMSGNHDFDFGRKGQPYFRGSLDEMKVYDRILPASEVKALFNSYQNPIIRTSGEHNATVGTNFSLTLAADNGPTTYLAEGLPTGLSLNVSTGQITGILSQPGYHRVFVKAMNEHGTGSDTIAIIARPQTDQYGWPVDVPGGSDIPQNGLVLWLDANDVDGDGEFDTGTDHLRLTNWADKAGKDHNATQATAANQPEIRSGQISGKPSLNVLVFDGNQSLSFPTIAQGRTFFWVLQRHAQGNKDAHYFGQEGSTLWYQNTQSGAFRISTNHSHVGSQIRNGSWRNNGIVNDMSFYSDSRVLSLTATGMTSSNLIGKRGDANEYYIGNISEILVYDRVLSTSEIETAEKYLGQKWGGSISHDTTPSPSGNPPTYQVTPANDSVTTAHLTEQILKYLKPEITTQPQAQTVFADTNHTISVSVEGKYLTYQWKKNGTALAGETNATLTITDANATQHDGNYTVVVSNDFGSVESGEMEINVVTEVLDGLVGWWPLDGNTSDLSGQGNHGIISGSPNWVIGKIGGAFSFNGSETISSNANYGTQNTISVWCNFSSTATAQYQMVWSFSNPNLSFTASDVSLNSLDGSGNKFADFNTLEYAGQWLHFVTINTTGQTELFLNAQSLGTANYVSPEENIFVIGRSGYSLKGMVDEVRIYDRALSNAEVQALYQLGQ